MIPRVFQLFLLLIMSSQSVTKEGQRSAQRAEVNRQLAAIAAASQAGMAGCPLEQQQKAAAEAAREFHAGTPSVRSSNLGPCGGVAKRSSQAMPTGGFSFLSGTAKAAVQVRLVFWESAITIVIPLKLPSRTPFFALKCWL